MTLWGWLCGIFIKEQIALAAYHQNMTITYRVKNGLYVNITNECTNRCEFCIRNNGPGAYGSDSLWLEREPTREEVLADIERQNPENFEEIVFCGYGEPTCRLHDMLWICRQIRARWKNIRIRLNTNGHASLFYGEDTTPLFAGLFDVVSISLNAADAQTYDKICRSIYREEAFYGVLKFARDIKKYVPCVILTVVAGFISDEEIKKCARIAEELGVKLRVRSYI